MKTNVEPEIVTKNGKPVSVILPIEEYQQMLERLEDAEDVAWLKRARKIKRTPARCAIPRRSCVAQSRRRSVFRWVAQTHWNET